LGWYNALLALLIFLVVVGKALTLFDLEPVLGLFLALAYGWVGLVLLQKETAMRVLQAEGRL
jgi:hypothetical protein